MGPRLQSTRSNEYSQIHWRTQGGSCRPRACALHANHRETCLKPEQPHRKRHTHAPQSGTKQHPLDNSPPKNGAQTHESLPNFTLRTLPLQQHCCLCPSRSPDCFCNTARTRTTNGMVAPASTLADIWCNSGHSTLMVATRHVHGKWPTRRPQRGDGHPNLCAVHDCSSHPRPPPTRAPEPRHWIALLLHSRGRSPFHTISERSHRLWQSHSLPNAVHGQNSNSWQFDPCHIKTMAILYIDVVEDSHDFAGRGNKMSRPRFGAYPGPATRHGGGLSSNNA